jgi:type IV pilus assembly protein PilN
MKDFNFFSPYIKTKKIFQKRYLSIGLGVFIIFSSIIGIYIFNIKTIKRLERDLAQIEKQINAKDLLKDFETIKQKKEKMKMMQQYYACIQAIDSKIRGKDVIHSDWIQRMAMSLPQNVWIQKMYLTTEGIKMEGFGETRASIAEFEHNLQKLQIFKKVHVDTIANAFYLSDNYLFYLQCTFN